MVKNIAKLNSDICAAPPKKWYSVPQTMYAFFIMIALSWSKKKNIKKSKICKAIMIAGPSLFFTIIAEAVVIIELARHTESLVNDNSTNLEDIDDKSHLPMVQFICISLFLIDMSSKFFATLRNIISIFSKEIKYEEENFTIQIKKCSKALIFISMLPDLVTWIAVTIIGIRFLLISSSTTQIIIDTLAVNYIVDVDDMMFNSFVPEKIKDSIEKIQFSGIMNTKTSRISSYYNLYVHLPLIIVITAVIVYINTDVDLGTKEYAVFSAFCLCFLSILASIITTKKRSKVFPLHKKNGYF